MENIKCYYWNDYIKIEKENPLFMHVNEDGYVNIVQYPLKIDKSVLFKLVYDRTNSHMIYDIEQSKRDIPRYNGFIETNNVLIRFEVGNFSYEYFNNILKSNYNNNQIVDILNFCPQQIFIVILEEIMKNWENCSVARTTHQLIVKQSSVARILEGKLLKGEEFIKNFRAKLKMRYDEDFVTLKVNYY